jgi:predicted NAD/FAD-binding protein
MKIAVIGSGISGLSAAWLLSWRHDVTVFEKDSRLGGHSNTCFARTADGEVAVDTGFIVYNEQTYPNLTALFAHLGVPTAPTQMSFAVTDGGRYEYSGNGLTGLFGQRSNLFRPKQWCLVSDLLRFFRTAQDRLDAYPKWVTLGAFLNGEGYSSTFVDDHIVPMGAAIWSTPMRDMLDFPARSFIAFYANHGMLQAQGRPAWRTVSGGSREYVQALRAASDVEVITRAPVRRVVRHAERIHVEDASGVVRLFDHVVIATHADQALRMLAAPTDEEHRLLGTFRYERNFAVLHRDRRFMPRRRRLWASWNYLRQGEGTDRALCVTYWMNSLQNLPTATDVFVTLNPMHDIHPKAMDTAIYYAHPVFSAEAVDAQRSLWRLQGIQRTWFCGSYFGHGFHEDGLQSGLAVAEQLGGVRRPWTVADESGRIHVTEPATLSDERAATAAGWLEAAE